MSRGNIATSGMTISSRTRTNEIVEFCPKLVEGHSNIVLKKACCGDLFTACLTGKLSLVVVCCMLVVVVAFICDDYIR